METKRQILGCISAWWNDTLRKHCKHWRIAKVDRWLLERGEEWLRKTLRPYKLVEWERLFDYEQYPTGESLSNIADNIVLAWWRGEISHDDAVRRFFAALMENKYGILASGIERVEVRGENIVVWAHHTLRWSGNERIIDALKCPPNDIFFYRYLERYDAGGHYYFKIPDFLLPKEILEGGD